ncbi:MAG: hypothetical protein V4651_08260 [Bacteroidota bacterium]
MTQEFESISGKWVPVDHAKERDEAENRTEAFNEMLAALQAMDAYWQSGFIYRKPELWQQIKAAIAKATDQKCVQ